MVIASEPIDLAYSDVAVPIKEHSLGKSKHFVTLLDKYSPCPLVRFKHSKPEAGETVFSMMKEIQNWFRSGLNRITHID